MPWIKHLKYLYVISGCFFCLLIYRCTTISSTSSSTSSTSVNPQPIHSADNVKTQAPPRDSNAKNPSSQPAAPALTTKHGSAKDQPRDHELPRNNRVITRNELKTFLARGPHDFIQKVQVRPYLHKGKFVGWRVVSYDGPGPILPGDIVRRINGYKIERPEECMAVWKTLETHPYLQIDLFRKGKRLVLHYHIQ